MKLIRKAGVTSEIWQVFVRDSSSATGGGLTGLAFNTASLVAYYHRDTDTTATAISLVTMTVGTFTSSGFKEIDATNMPGWYQFCPPNAALASGAKSCGFHLKGAANMAPLPMECQLVSVDVDDAVRLGLTALPNVASGNAGAVVTSGTGTAQLSVSSGLVTVGTVAAAASNVKKNTALSAFEFVMTDSTTHAPKTGVTVTATRSLDGAAFAACANSPAEVSSGVYKIDLAAADLNANVVTLRFTGTASDDLLVTLITQP